MTGHRALMQTKQRLSGPVSSQEPPLVPQEPHPAPYSSHQRSNHSTSPVTRGEKSKTTFNNRVLHEQDGWTQGTAGTAGHHSCAAGSACSNSRAVYKARLKEASAEAASQQHCSIRHRRLGPAFIPSFLLFLFSFVFCFCQDETQGLVCARQGLYPRNHILSPKFHFN